MTNHIQSLLRSKGKAIVVPNKEKKEVNVGKISLKERPIVQAFFNEGLA